MVRIKVEFDKYNRTFKLLDAEFGSVPEDGAQYELFAPLMLESVGEEENFVLISSIPLAHA